MHDDDEGVNILVVEDDSDKKEGEVEDAEVGEIPDAIDGCS